MVVEREAVVLERGDVDRDDVPGEAAEGAWSRMRKITREKEHPRFHTVFPDFPVVLSRGLPAR